MEMEQVLLVASTNVGQVGEPTLKSRHLFNLSRLFVAQASGNYPPSKWSLLLWGRSLAPSTAFAKGMMSLHEVS